jgi:Zn-dependent peptidase ImmA (M78 family)
MRRLWRKLAERAEVTSFSVADVGETVCPALAGDWKLEVPARLARFGLVCHKTGVLAPMSTSLENVPSQELGERLRAARESAKVTQAAAADALNVARTTIVAMEQGQRRPKLDELQRLSKLYGTSLNALLRKEAVQVDLKPQFRRIIAEEDADVEIAAGLLSDLVKAEVELENLLGVRRIRNYPPERPLLPGDVMLQAEQDAFELRQWMGLGQAPVHDIVSLLELQLGVRVFIRRLPPKISGLYACDDRVGACILLNANHRRSRRMQTAAHELGHFISTRALPDTFQDCESDSRREERYANAFGRAFLTPPRAVMSSFKDVTAGASRLTRRHVILLAHIFSVSREAMVRRLEELMLVKQGTWDWFTANGGISDDQAREVLGENGEPDTEKQEAGRPTSFRLSLLAGEAWRRELLSEAQLARLLKIDRVEVRQLIDAIESEGRLDDGAPRLPA